MLRPIRLTISLLLLGSGAIQLLYASSHIDAQTSNYTAPGDTDLARTFNQTIRPFVTSYCTGCHSGPEPSASFDLQRYETMESVVDDFAHWELVQRKLTAKEMPPTSMKQPSEELRQKVIEWITALRKYETRKNAGDPGPV